jgi:hypothetical protein
MTATRGLTWHTLFILTLLALVFCGISNAAPVRDRFYSPSRNIECDANALNDGTIFSVTCVSFNNQRVAEINQTGNLTVLRNLPAYGFQHGSWPVLAYGKRWLRGSFSCLSEETGVTCYSVRTGRGFKIDRNTVVPVRAGSAPSARSNTWPPAGYFSWGANIAMKWGNSSCLSYEDSCYHIYVIARHGCPNGLFVTLNEYRNGVIVADTIGTIDSLPPGQRAYLDIPSQAPSSTSARVAKVTCH